MNTETPTQGPMLAPSKPSEPRDLARFDKLMDGLQGWRNSDHEDAIALHRHQIIEIIEGVKALRRGAGLSPDLKASQRPTVSSETNSPPTQSHLAGKGEL